MNYLEIKALAHRVDLAKGEERRRLVEKLIKELPKWDPLEGADEFTRWPARLLARVKQSGAERFS